MDACTQYGNLISIIKEETPWTPCSSDIDAELSGFNLSECTLALNDLFEALPKERKSSSFTKQCVVMEAANYALELEQSLQENEENRIDVTSLKIKDSFSLRSEGEIKRPKNGFIRYAMKYRTEMASKFPNLDNRNISCLLGLKWKKMNEEERKPYEEEFKQDMKLLREKHPHWMYTPKKNKKEEDVNTVVMPTRLRPQEKRKRKVLDCFEEIYPTSRKKSKPESGCKRRPRKKKTPIAKENPNDNVDINWDLFNGILVDALLMPPSCAVPNLMNEFDWENQLESMFDPSTHPWLQNVDSLTRFPQDDFCCNLQDQF